MGKEGSFRGHWDTPLNPKSHYHMMERTVELHKTLGRGKGSTRVSDTAWKEPQAKVKEKSLYWRCGSNRFCKSAFSILSARCLVFLYNNSGNIGSFCPWLPWFVHTRKYSLFRLQMEKISNSSQTILFWVSLWLVSPFCFNLLSIPAELNISISGLPSLYWCRIFIS